MIELFFFENYPSSNSYFSSSLFSEVSAVNLHKSAKIWAKTAVYNSQTDFIRFEEQTIFCEMSEALYWSQTVLKNRTFLLRMIEDARKQEIWKMRQILKEVVTFFIRHDLFEKFVSEETVQVGVNLYNDSRCYYRKGKKKEKGRTEFEFNLKKYLLDLLNQVREIKSSKDRSYD